MRYIEGDNRHQHSLLPPVVDDYVDADARVRIVDAFVDQLDCIALGFARAEPAETGRPGYDPRDLLKLYVYGYLNEVRSSRRLERECRRNIELMWLLRRLMPDFKTIADFRRDNPEALVGACRAFVLFCRSEGLFGGDVVALDGSKFQAVASPKKVIGRHDIAQETAKIDERIAAHLRRMDAEDAAELGDTKHRRTVAIVASLRERRAELDRYARQLDDEDRVTIVVGEPEARPMGCGRGYKPPCYNVQTAVDAASHLIVAHDVTTHSNDNRQLHVMARAAKDALAVDQLRVIADAGYSNGAAAAACEADGIEPCAPTNRAMNNKGDFFDRSAFIFDPQGDSYRCPGGKDLPRISTRLSDNCIRYAAAPSDCAACSLKQKCTGGSRRYVQRHTHEDALDRMQARIDAEPRLMQLRRCLAEHPFGTIKRMNGGRFLVRGVRKVRGEAALSILAYNMLRATNLVGAHSLKARLA